MSLSWFVYERISVHNYNSDLWGLIEVFMCAQLQKPRQRQMYPALLLKSSDGTFNYLIQCRGLFWSGFYFIAILHSHALGFGSREKFICLKLLIVIQTHSDWLYLSLSVKQRRGAEWSRVARWRQRGRAVQTSGGGRGRPWGPRQAQTTGLCP